VKQSIREINGRPVSLVDGSVDVAWVKMHPKVRTLVMRAYSNHNNATDEDMNVFLKSRRSKVS
jgi:hypothetical protein